MASRKQVRVDYFKLLRAIILIGLILWLSGTLIYDQLINPKKPYYVQYGTLNIEETARAVVIRKEYVVKTYSIGSIKFYVKEDGRVDSRQRILTQKCSEEYKAVSARKIRNKKNKYPVPSQKNIEKEVNDNTIELASIIRSGEYPKVENTRNALDSKIKVLGKSKSSRDLSKPGDDGYRELVFGGEGYYLRQNIDFYSPVSGYLTFDLDGYEDILTLQNMYEINYDNIESLNVKAVNTRKKSYSSGDSVIKIIDDELLHIVIKVAKDKIDLYQKDKDVVLGIEGTSILGKIVDVYESPNSNGVVVIKLNEFSKIFCDKRFMDITVKIEGHEGLSVKSDSITEKNGSKGVYVLDMYKKPEFVPVSVIGKNESSLIVRDGYFSGYVNGKISRIKTLDKGDSVLRFGDRWN